MSQVDDRRPDSMAETSCGEMPSSSPSSFWLIPSIQRGRCIPYRAEVKQLVAQIEALAVQRQQEEGS